MSGKIDRANLRLFVLEGTNDPRTKWGREERYRQVTDEELAGLGYIRVQSEAQARRKDKLITFIAEIQCPANQVSRYVWREDSGELEEDPDYNMNMAVEILSGAVAVAVGAGLQVVAARAKHDR